jgi:protein TonB
VKPEEAAQLMTSDQAQVEVQNTDVGVEVQEEVKEEVQEEAEPEPFVVVEEMPMFPGGDAELLKYIAEHTQYPDVAKENNIQGRVIVRFCVTSKGAVNQVSVLKGVDPELDAEAVRVVNSLPAFKPGKQGGKPVPVWYMVPITFTLK